MQGPFFNFPLNLILYCLACVEKGLGLLYVMDNQSEFLDFSSFFFFFIWITGISTHYSTLLYRKMLENKEESLSSASFIDKFLLNS